MRPEYDCGSHSDRYDHKNDYELLSLRLTEQHDAMQEISSGHLKSAVSVTAFTQHSFEEGGLPKQSDNTPDQLGTAARRPVDPARDRRVSSERGKSRPLNCYFG